MLRVAVSVSRSPSVIVAVSVTRFGSAQLRRRVALVRIGRIVVHHRPDLVERHIAGVGVQRDGEHRAAGRRRARHHRAGRVHAQRHRLIGQRVDQTAGHIRRGNAELVADRVRILDVVVVRVLEPVVAKGADVNRPANDAEASRRKSRSRPPSASAPPPPTIIDGPSSSNLKASPMLRVAVSVSRSPSVMVAVSVTRFAALSSAGESLSSGSVGSSCTTARTWSSVTSPVSAFSVMVKHRAAGRRRARHTPCRPRSRSASPPHWSACRPDRWPHSARKCRA